MTAWGSCLHGRAEIGERIGEECLANGFQQRVEGLPALVRGVPAVAIEPDEAVEVGLEKRRRTHHHRGSAYAIGVARREGEDVRASSTASAGGYGVEPEMVEEVRTVGGDDGDSASRKPGRLAVAGSVEHDQAHVEPVVHALVGVTREAGSRRALKPQHRLSLGWAVLAPGHCAAVAHCESPVAHGSKSRR